MTSKVEQKRRVLFISQDIVGEVMAGPGIRYYHLARTLARDANVVLAVPHESSSVIQGQEFDLVRYTRHDWDSLESQVCTAEIVVCPSDIVSDFPQLGQNSTFLVIDGYDPLLAEWLALSRDVDVETQNVHWWQRMCRLNQQYLAGDFFICASERQRDWWLGLLEANGRINAWTFREDPSLRRLVEIVPFGLPETSPQHTRAVLKGVLPGIGKDDRIILWGGGLWPWLDSLTAVHAVAKVWQQRQDLRLVLPGTEHPNPWMKGMPTHMQVTRQAAEELGLLDKAIFFTDWIPYADWTNVLLESDVALALGHDTLESRLAFRSRVLEYIWAGLPIIATRGDATCELVEEYGLGAAVAYDDVDGVAAAISRLLERPRPALNGGFKQARHQLTWKRAARPLIEFCLDPRQAPDKETMGENLGTPFYLEEQIHLTRERDYLLQEKARLIQERDYWQGLVEQYEQGRFIRFMKRVDELRRSFRGDD